MGAAILGAALVVLAGLGSRRVTALALPAAAVVAGGAVAVGSATAARHGLVHWQKWNLAHVATGGHGFGFVWDAQYGGIEWPKHPTVVLQVQSARPPSYLRAAVLDDFRGDAWAIGLPRPSDSLEPAAAFQPRNQTTEVVTVQGFADRRLVGGSIPVRFSAGSAKLDEPGPGFASLGEDPPRGFRYVVWSYTARPTAAELARSAPAYPQALVDDGLLDVGDGVNVPPFGTPNRFSMVRADVGHDPGLGHYLPLANLAEQVAGGSRTPYEAATRLEDWFVSSGGFSYSNHPLVVNPPLVGFVTQTQRGYCQYFAGAMALMLRYLGVPARVAVGFAGGSYSPSKHAWLVTDREAHAWVEVWFKGYGWLPFDPTPADPGAAPRAATAGTDAGGGSASGPVLPFPNFRPGAGPSPVASAQDAHRHGVTGPHAHSLSGASDVGVGGGSGSDRSRPVLLLLLVLAGAGASVVLTKEGFWLIRRVRRDPRGAAGACRQELAAFLVDQRVEVPYSATLAELGELVQGEFGVRPDSFVTAATAARFGPSERAGAAARTARRELKAVLDGIRRSLTRRERIRGLFSLRSLTRAAGPVDASASLDGAVGSTGS
jgi:transglutaminase-like putative cysteine protease